MTDVLLNYVMKVNKTIPLATPDLQYLQNVLVVVKPKESVQPEIVQVTNSEQLAAVTSSTAPLELLAAGKSYFYCLPVNELNLDAATITNPQGYEYYTILIDPAFTDDEVEALVAPTDFSGVIGGASHDDAFVEAQNKKDGFSWFWQGASTTGLNMYHSFGALLSKPKNKWSNQQYIKLPYDDGISSIGTAEAMFDMRCNFALTGKQYGTRLALFCVGSESGEVNAIIAPYVYEEVTVRLQGDALTYINLNEPQYTIAEAALLQSHLQKKLDNYTTSGLINGGTIEVTAGNDQFIMNGSIAIAKPSALWRIKANMIQGGIE